MTSLYLVLLPALLCLVPPSLTFPMPYSFLFQGGMNYFDFYEDYNYHGGGDNYHGGGDNYHGGGGYTGGYDGGYDGGYMSVPDDGYMSVSDGGYMSVSDNGYMSVTDGGYMSVPGFTQQR